MNIKTEDKALNRAFDLLKSQRSVFKIYYCPVDGWYEINEYKVCAIKRKSNHELMVGFNCVSDTRKSFSTRLSELFKHGSFESYRENGARIYRSYALSKESADRALNYMKDHFSK